MQNSRPLGRMMLALMALGGSGCANLSSNNHVRPYGAPRLEQTDMAALGRSLASQIAADGISRVDMHLFPDRLPEGQSQGETLGSNTGYVVNGLLSGPQGLHLIEQWTLPPTRSWIITALCHCAATGGELSTNFKNQRIFAGLHEASHLEAFVHGEQPGTSCIGFRAESMPRSTGLRCNRAERIADTSASLYICSNYHDSCSYPVVIEHLRRLIMEPTHYTASSIASAMDQYRRSPLRGLTIGQTEEWAVEIINRQTGLDKEYDFAARVQRDINEQTLVTLPLDIQMGLRTIADSRAALFGPGGLARSGHTAHRHPEL